MYNEKINKNNFFEENCLRECPLQCYLDQFEATLSSYDLIPKMYMDYLYSNENLSGDFVSKAKNVPSEDVKKSFVYFNVFFKELSYEMSTESPQLNLITLFANLGGYLGLFMGVSVFSVFEPIQVLIEIYWMRKNVKIEIIN